VWPSLDMEMKAASTEKTCSSFYRLEGSLNYFLMKEQKSESEQHTVTLHKALLHSNMLEL